MKKILVVDDSLTDCMILEKMLSKEEDLAAYELKKAHSCLQAKELLSAEEFDISLLDYNLPDGTGLDILGFINENSMDMPVIMVTGQGDEAIAVKTIKEGAYDYVVKQEGYAVTVPVVIRRVLAEFDRKKEKERLEKELADKNRELEKANSELKKLDELKSEFLSNVSHELRTPLTSIIQAVALLLGEKIGSVNESQKEFLSIIDEDIRRLKRLINDLLDISKLESGKSDIDRTDTDIKHIVDKVVASLNALASIKKIKITNKIDDNGFIVFADEEKIIQVLTNLIGNAIKYIDEAGNVIITAEQVSESGRDLIKVSVKDDGPGIAADQLDKLFDKFHQVKRHVGSGAHGTGLGLSIAKQIVQLHKGRIWVESEEGKGTVFSFTLERFTPELPLISRLDIMMADKDLKGGICLMMINILNRGEVSDVSYDSFRKSILDSLRVPDDLLVEVENGIGLLLRCRDDKMFAAEDRLRNILMSSGEAEGISFSVGVAVYPKDGITAAEIVGKAKQTVSRYI